MKNVYPISFYLFIVVVFAGQVVSQEISAYSDDHPIFIRGNGTEDIPFELFDNIIYLPVKIDESETQSFILDTGCGHASAIDENLARTLNLTFGEKRSLYGAGENQVDIFMIDDVDVSVSGLSFHDQLFFTIPFDSIDPHWGKRKDGLLGANLLSKVVTEINYESKSVRFYHPASFEYRGKGEAVPFQNFGQPYIAGKLFLYGKKRPVDAYFMIDTGMRITSLTRPFAMENDLAVQSPKTVTTMSGYGIGGESWGVIGRVKSVQIGNIMIDQPVVDFSTDEKGALASPHFSGIIGADILHRFQVVIDYPEQKIYLEKNRYFNQPFEFDMSGIRLVSEGTHFRRYRIFHIIERSPAAEAGLQVGDIIVSVNGEKSVHYTMEEMKQLLIGDGKKVRLEVSRNSKKWVVELRLRRMV